MSDNKNISIPAITITTAVAGTVVSVGYIGTSIEAITGQLSFTYGSGGTTAKFWLQSSVDGGTTWFDIMNFAATTSSTNLIGTTVRTGSQVPAATTDATLADNTVYANRFGDLLRLKYTTTGTYAGTTTAKLDLLLK